MSRFHSSIINLLLVLALLACAEERPTRPSGENAVLPAIPLSSDPVLWSSPIVDAMRIDDTLFRVDLDSIIRSHEFQQLEIRVTWVRGSCAANIDLWNPLLSRWAYIERHDVPYGCVPEVCPGRRMVSDLGIDPADLLKASANIITFRRDRNRAVQCQVLDLDNRYKRIAIPYLTSVASVAWDVNLYVATRTTPYPDGDFDSLRVYRPDGVQVRSTALQFLPNSMTWSPNGLWITHDYHPVIFSLCDSTGMEQSRFTYPADKCPSMASSIGSGAAWLNDRLLVIDECDSMIYLIDPSASLNAGVAIISDSISFKEHCWSLASDGRFILAVTNVLQVYTLQGRLVHQLPAPYSMGSAAWDGVALWAAHLGPLGATSDDNVISRFLLE